MITKLRYAALIATVCVLSSQAKPVKAKIDVNPLVKADGQAIIEKGVFEPGCYYGDSLSDHAPVIYGELGTWNISSPISHFVIKPDANTTKTFYNHKFFTDSKGNLVSKSGGNVGFLQGSEVVLFTPQDKRGYAAISNAYIDRVNKIAKAIKKLFLNRKNLKYFVLQEIPGSWEKNMSGENIQGLIKAAFAPEVGETQKLAITFFATDPKSATPRPEMKAPELKSLQKRHVAIDVAIVHKEAVKLEQEISDHYNRLVPFCSKKDKSCFVSAHMPFTETDAELEGRCKAIHDQVFQLLNNGYTKVKIAGDFNTHANRIANICNKALIFTGASVKLHTSKGNQGSSCGSNNGDMSMYNIDILIEVIARAI